MFRISRMLVSVPIVMACAAVGTVSLMKVIEKFVPGEDNPKDSAEE